MSRPVVAISRFSFVAKLVSSSRRKYHQYQFFLVLQREHGSSSRLVYSSTRVYKHPDISLRGPASASAPASQAFGPGKFRYCSNSVFSRGERFAGSIAETLGEVAAFARLAHLAECCLAVLYALVPKAHNRAAPLGGICVQWAPTGLLSLARRRNQPSRVPTTNFAVQAPIPAYYQQRQISS